MKRIACVLCLLIALFTDAGTLTASPSLPLSADPPTAPVKLIFIHHSTGGNWLANPNNDQPYGGLGRALMENNYFVSATNYGWGPDGIGDRTDIPNWPEWFVGPNRDVYLDALYNESEQNVGDFGDWSRLPDDPGGENVVIMFKSCFPNSDLYGNPDDPPLDEPNDYDYTVANAKAVYIALLDYFETRQDKLFVVITAPPLMEGDTTAERALNAREFNYWLVYDWLADYPYANVAVFDYFNVLTDPNNHHWWNGSEIERLQATENNFAAYPSGDSHPNTEGHTKATAEFVPLLNVAYNRWQAGGVVAPPPAEPTTSPTEEATAAPPETDTAPVATTAGRVIDDFEGDFQWYADVGEGATLECRADGDAHGGAAALQVAYAIPADGWGGCGRYYDIPQDWSDGDGLSFWLRADDPDQWVTLILYSGPIDAPTPFEFSFEASTDWSAITIPWSDFARASWADDSGLAELDPARITSIAFSFGAGQGNVWADDIERSSGETPPPEPPTPEQPTEAPAAEEQPPTAPAEPTEEPRGGLCASAPLALILLAVGFVRERSLRKSVKRYLSHSLVIILLGVLLACSAQGTETPIAITDTPAPANPPASPTPFAAPPSGDLLGPDDFTYLGAFRLPGGDAPPRTFAYGGNAMTFNPDNGTLFVMGHNRMPYGELPDGNQLAEISIPEPVDSRNLDDLPYAAFRQDFQDVTAGYFTELEEIPKVGLQYLNHPATGPKIHIGWGQHLQPDGIASHGWFSAHLAEPNFQGTWFIGEQNLYSTNGYLFDIPTNWADTHVHGRYLATGRMRDGGQGGMGPALFAYRPWSEDGSPPAPGTHLPATTLLLYENAYHTENIERAMNGYQHPDEWEGGAWLTTASGKSAVLFAGTKSTGTKYWYGFIHPDGPELPCVSPHADFTACRLADGTPCPPEDFAGCCDEDAGTCASGRGWWSTRFDAQFILYDPAQLAQVAAGTLESWQPQPYASLDLDEHLYLNPPEWDVTMLGWGDQRRNRIGDASFDRAGSRLYVLELYADGGKPVVHVWRVE